MEAQSMTRNLFYACVLVSGAVLATVWALALGCEGSFCFGTSLRTEAGQDRTGAGEVPGAGRELLGETAQEPASAEASGAWMRAAEVTIEYDPRSPRVPQVSSWLQAASTTALECCPLSDDRPTYGSTGAFSTSSFKPRHSPAPDHIDPAPNQA